MTSNSGPAANFLRLRLHRDHLYLDAASYEAHLAPAASVALIRNADDLIIFPISNVEAGGFYIKQINAKGDRAIHAADFFRLHSVSETLDVLIEAHLQTETAGYVVQSLFTDRKLSLQ